MTIGGESIQSTNPRALSFLLGVGLLVCSLIPSALAEEGSSSDPRPSVRSRRNFLNIGSTHRDHAELNTALEEAGYEPFAEKGTRLGWVTYSYGQSKWIVGSSGEFMFLRTDGPEQLEAMTISIPLNVQLGYRLIEHPTLMLFPFVGIGFIYQSLDVAYDVPVDFEGQLSYPVGESHFTSFTPIISAGIQVDNLFTMRSVDGRDHGLTLGIRLEYLHGLASDRWSSTMRTVNQAPEVTTDSWSVAILFGWGSQGATSED